MAPGFLPMSVVAPSIPQSLLVQQGNGQVFLSWNPCAGATGYPVQRSTDNATWSTLSTPATPSYLDTTVVLNTTYYYQVAASNASATSSYTLSQSVVPTISGQMSLGELRLHAQERADRVNSSFVSTPEWNYYINQSYFELYDILTTLYEDYYRAPSAIIATTGTTPNYSLPDGQTSFLNNSGASFVPAPLYKITGVDLGLNGTSLTTNAWVTVHRYDWIERNSFVYPNMTSSALGVFNLRYRVMGSQITFIPTPSAGQYIQLWYIPRLTTLLQDSDVADGVSGWLEYVILDAAIKALQKEESDVGVLMAQKQALLDRIQSSAMNRDAGEPDTISATRNQFFGNYGSNGSDGGSGGY